jgi:hypothetical protein
VTETDSASQTAPPFIVEGEIRLKTSMSMLFSDILSQELSETISAPETLGVLQKYLHNQPLEELNKKDLKPLFESIPEPVTDLIREAFFCSGALIKRISCRYPLHMGDPFIFRGSGLMADLELLDGKVIAIRPLKHR